MRGVNGDGAARRPRSSDDRRAALRGARARARRRAARAPRQATPSSVRGADAVTLLIAAATSYASYEDVSGDPAAQGAVSLGRASRKPFDALRAAHVRDHRRLFDRVTLDLGTTRCDGAADRRARARLRRRRRPGARRALFPVRPLSADRQLAARDRSRPTCRASGTTACRRRGAASTRSTSTPR